MIEYECHQCHNKFMNYRSDKSKYCSKPCKDLGIQVNHAHSCNFCGKLFSSKKKTSKYCSMSCAGVVNNGLVKNRRGGSGVGEKHWNWKRGWNLNGSGYIEVRVDIKKRKYGHRLVMEQHLGRELLRTEHVHHINGDKTDNNIENLVVLSPSDHTKLHLEKRWHG